MSDKPAAICGQQEWSLIPQVMCVCVRVSGPQVLRPGVLWFLRNLNDPDFNPVQEMIHLPIYRHLRRFILSVVVFGSIVLLMLWLPVRLIKLLLPLFLPYNVMLYRSANGGPGEGLKGACSPLIGCLSMVLWGVFVEVVQASVFTLMCNRSSSFF